MPKISNINLKAILSIATALCIGGNAVSCTPSKNTEKQDNSQVSYSSTETKKNNKVSISEDVLFYMSNITYGGLNHYKKDNSELSILTPQQKENLHKCATSYVIYLEAQENHDEAKMSQAINDMVDAIDNFGDYSETLAKTLKDLTVSNDDIYLFGANLNAQSIVKNEDYDAYLYMLYSHNSRFQITTNNYKGFVYGNPRYTYYGEDSIDRKINEFNEFLHLLNKFYHDPIYRLEDISGNSIICNREMCASMISDKDLFDRYDFSGVFRKCTLSNDNHDWVLKSDDNILRIIFDDKLFKDLNELAKQTGQTSFDYATMNALGITYNVACDLSLKIDLDMYYQMDKKNRLLN